MEILGVGLPELLFIALLALVILGPKELVKTGRTVGTWLRKLVVSDDWKVVQKVSREIRRIPNELMREANEGLKDELTQVSKEVENTGKALTEPVMSTNQMN